MLEEPCKHKSREKSYVICGAKNRKGLPCSKPPIKGRTRCRLHGGRTPVGVSSVHFKTGRWSRYLPQALARLYESAESDPFSKSHGPDLNLLDAKIATLLQGIDQGNPGEQLARIQSIWVRFKRAKEKEQSETLDRCISEIDRLLDGKDMSNDWQEIYQCMDLRRKTLEAEQKRLKDHQQMIPLEELLILTHFLSDSIKTAVLKHADPGSARTIILDITRDLSLCLSRYASPRSVLNRFDHQT